MKELKYRKAWQLVDDGNGNKVKSGLFFTEAYGAEVELTDELAEINILEQSLLRPLREYALDNTNAYALAKIQEIEADIVALRAKL